MVDHFGNIHTSHSVIHCVSEKSSPFNFCDNFPNSKPIQIIFGGNIAHKIWNKLAYNNFNIYLSYVTSLLHKMSPIFSQFQNVKILMSHFRQFLRWWYYHRSCFLQSVCSKFSQLFFWQILFKLVYSWESYDKNKRGALFIETQCICVGKTVMLQYYWSSSGRVHYSRHSSEFLDTAHHF